MSITPSLLNQISNADDDRVIRALEALQAGKMAVTLLYNGGVLTAEVTSTVTLGKKNPVEKTETYTTILTPTRYECSCKDWQYRHESQPGFICKHGLAAIMYGQSEQADEQQQAA